jgi:predicted small secreted protein
MFMKKYLLTGIVLTSALLLTACSTTTGTGKESSQVAQQQKLYVENQPVPAFDWSLERHMMIKLYEARNNAVITYSYVRNLQGQIIFSCNSIGFPIPANTQLTNPNAVQQSRVNEFNYYEVLPQAEPNGLYSSTSTMGTYVFCLNQDGTVSPTYFESDVEAHTQKLNENGTGLTGESSLKIETKK